MTYATVWMEADVTYTETTTASRAGGSMQDTWGYWVVSATLPTMQTTLTGEVNTQFANMRSTSAGLSISIDVMRQGVTRSYAVPQTW